MTENDMAALRSRIDQLERENAAYSNAHTILLGERDAAREKCHRLSKELEHFTHACSEAGGASVEFQRQLLAANSRIERLEAALQTAWTAMDKARGILTNDNPRENCWWGMLDTKPLRESLAAADGKQIKVETRLMDCPRSRMGIDPLELCPECKQVGWHDLVPNPKYKADVQRPFNRDEAAGYARFIDETFDAADGQNSGEQEL